MFETFSLCIYLCHTWFTPLCGLVHMASLQQWKARESASG